MLDVQLLLPMNPDPLFIIVIRVDPWESYQDTWQTTCSVLEHHRDLMKVRTRLSTNAIVVQNGDQIADPFKGI